MNTKRALLYIMLLSIASTQVLLSSNSRISCQLIEPTCTDDILQHTYRDQNMCKLFDEIPHELKNLSYVVYPTCIEYDNERFSYNKRFNIFPHAIILPRTIEEVVYVLEVLRKHNLCFSLRSGGHCYEPGSLSSGYVIDMSNFNTIEMDTEREEVFIGAGCLLGSVIETLAAKGYAIPTGTCPSVGITGLALGGGLGLLTRPYGLTCDSIKSITLVTADAQVIEVTHDSHPDLFWALRGAGHNAFGIVLGFTFKMHYVPTVTTFKLEWKWNTAKIPAIVQAWQHWITQLPRSISTELHFKYFDGEPTIEIIGLKVGSERFTEWKKVFGKLLPRCTIARERYIDAAIRHASLHTVPYVDAAKEFAGVYTLPFSKVKSKFLMKPLCIKPIRLIVDFFEYLRRHRVPYFVFFEFGAAGGKMAEEHTAFYARHALAWLFQFIYYEKQCQTCEALRLINSFYNEIARYFSPYSYVNTTDYCLRKSYLKAYYGNHVKRLMKVKRNYDPSNIFCWKQGIPLCGRRRD